MSDFDLELQTAQAEAARSRRTAKWTMMGLAGLSIILFGAVAIAVWLANDNAHLAEANRAYGIEQQQEKQNLAQEFDAACKSEDFTTSPAGSNICQKAEQVAAEPGKAVEGPQGIQGLQGPQGERGFPGVAGATGAKGDKGDVGPQGIAGLLGLTGLAGANGADGPVGPPGPVGPMGPMGPMGPAGLTGADGAQGPAGADSTVPGPAGADGATGATGPQGEPGRGIETTTCTTGGRWVITYTDGATQDAGNCRVVSTQPSEVTP